MHMLVTVVAAALIGATAGFFVRKRSSGWCPTCGGPAQLWAAYTASELLKRAAMGAEAPNSSGERQPAAGVQVRLGVPHSLIRVGHAEPSHTR